MDCRTAEVDTKVVQDSSGRYTDNSIFINDSCGGKYQTALLKLKANLA